MTITIELTSEEEIRLREKAERQGQAPEGFVHHLVHTGLFDSAAVPASQPTISDEAHEGLLRRLLASGLLTERPAHPGRVVTFAPITVLGQPVSETLLEERR